MGDSEKVKHNFEDQFHWSREFWLQSTDFLNWHRFFALTKAILDIKPKSMLEIGEGSAVLRRIIEPMVDKYETMDINEKLKPTYLNDVRILNQGLTEKFECVIAADILEHIPFEDLGKAFKNLPSYLKSGGQALITIPHRSHYFFWMTSLDHKLHLWRYPTLKKLLFGKSSIDPNHCWEIGDGKHGVKDVEEIMKRAGFSIEKRQKLLYVDFWTLKK